MTSNIGIIIRREYLERVSKKSFIITTLLIPVFMLLLSAAPALIMSLNTSGTKNIMVIDESGKILPGLECGETVRFTSTALPLDSLMGREDIDGILVIDKQIVSKPEMLRLYTRDAASTELIGNIENQVERIVERERIESFNITDLSKILEEVKVNVTLPTSRITDENEATESSTLLSAVLGMVMTLILYMFLIMYGQMVMTSIIEEKNNRVLEIMVSSVKPSHLMMGKIIGVGLVAVTQVILWGLLMSIISSFVMPAILPDAMATDIAAYNAGNLDTATAANDIEIVQIFSALGSIGYIMGIFGYMLLFLIGGFLFYAAINAAFGSAVDNVQDAGQLQMFVVLPIIIGLIFGISVVNDPSSPMAIWMSFIPFTSPMVMMARIPFGIPAWEIIASLVILYASFIVTVWIAAKIYRVGIFMYGKKPNLKELIKWARYK